MKDLLNVITELKAPKGQRNNFGNYNYRSCEDILEAVKPLLLKHSLMMSISDKVINIGSHNYIESTVIVFDLSGKVVNTVTAYAREPETQKGMSDSQLTGSTASYARKYALNGMYLIDDTKDADTQDNSKNATTADYKEQTARINSSETMDVLKMTWADIWKSLDNDHAGRQALMAVYNKKKQELSK
jgi:hypothetical protein